METILDTCADSVGNICASWILVFIVASIYGKCLGFRALPSKCLDAAGQNRGQNVILAVAATCTIMCMAGISNYVLIFSFANSIQKYRCRLYPVIWIA